jgi:cytochrome c oxidase subunit 6b
MCTGICVVQGEDYEPCQFFYRNFHTICPNAWIEKWDEQREKGAFPANI